MKNGDIDLANPAKSTIYLKLSPNSGISHPVKASSLELQKILIWVNQGAKNN